MERKNAVTMKGNGVTLIGPELKVGDTVPEFGLVDNGLAPVKLSDLPAKPKIISVVTSLDTGVCSMQTKKFNDEAAKLSEKVELLTISADLPFAQKRFKEAEGTDKVNFLSDYRDGKFGEEYGLMIKELRLLARTVIVVDKENKITHIEVVPEVTDEPNYEAALNAVNKLL